MSYERISKYNNNNNLTNKRKVRSNMEYLTDDQMKRERPIKNAYTKKNNVIQKYFTTPGQHTTAIKKPTPGSPLSLSFMPRKFYHNS